MTWGILVVNLVAALGGLAGIGAFFNLLLIRRKTRMEAADIEQSISDKVLKNVNTDNETLRKERDELKADVETIKVECNAFRTKLHQYELDQFETRMLIIRLINWAKVAGDELHNYGSHMEPPPTADLINKIKTIS